MAPNREPLGRSQRFASTQSSPSRRPRGPWGFTETHPPGFWVRLKERGPSQDISLLRIKKKDVFPRISLLKTLKDESM